jgi:hypothetical protein
MLLAASLRCFIANVGKGFASSHFEMTVPRYSLVPLCVLKNTSTSIVMLCKNNILAVAHAGCRICLFFWRNSKIIVDS